MDKQHTYIVYSQQAMMNRNIKHPSLIKRRVQSSQLSSSLLKCNGIISTFALRNTRLQPSPHFNLNLNPNPQAHNNNPFPLSHHRSIKQQFHSLDEPRCRQKEEEETEEFEEQRAQENFEGQGEEKKEGELVEKVRKNVYRSRRGKRSSGSKQKVLLRPKITDNTRLVIFFRNQIISLFNALGKRQQFINSLRGNRLSLASTPLKPSELEQRLLKQLNGKGKDKTRKNFNHLTNQQLRSLKYKPKPIVLVKKESKNTNNKEDEQDGEEEKEEVEEETDDCTDMNMWKRKNGVGYNQKVFIVKGGYRQLRQTLLAKGWSQNEEHRSPFFDLKWTTKICDIDYSALKNGQIVNHFNNNHHLTSKYGITRRLRSLPISHNIDIDRFYPRCYDLGDQNEFENFVESFKFAFAEGVGKRFMDDKERYMKLQLKIRTVLKVLRKNTLSFPEKVNKINNGQFPVITAQQWQIMTETDQLTQEQKAQKLQQLTVNDPCKSQEAYPRNMHEEIEKQLQKMKQADPQHHLNGPKNVWIAKPNFLSRGRGIRCFNNLYEIADYCLGRDVQFVIQKYIQRPLLIQGRKFDIRQWVFIQDYGPTKIYFYQECYFRFSMDDYSLDNIHNRFIHLTNNSVQKHNKKCKIQESMWQMAQFAQHIGEQKWKEIQNKIKNIVVWSVKSCENYVTAKKGSFQLVGFDFMIDEYLNPWLIQINMSPSMDNSTPVTKKLVKMLLHDTALLISSTKFKKNVGNYTCILQQDSDLVNFTQYNYKDKE